MIAYSTHTIVAHLSQLMPVLSSRRRRLRQQALAAAWSPVTTGGHITGVCACKTFSSAAAAVSSENKLPQRYNATVVTLDGRRGSRTKDEQYASRISSARTHGDVEKRNWKIEDQTARPENAVLRFQRLYFTSRTAATYN